MFENCWEKCARVTHERKRNTESYLERLWNGYFDVKESNERNYSEDADAQVICLCEKLLTMSVSVGAAVDQRSFCKSFSI